MRITFLVPGWVRKPVGGYRVVYEYASRLARRGHDVVVVHPRRLPPGGLGPAGFPLRVRRQLDFVRNLFARPAPGSQGADPRVDLRYVPDLSPRHVPAADIVVPTWWATAEAALRLPADRGARVYLIQSYEAWGGPGQRVDATWRAPMRKVVIARWLLEKGFELGVLPEDMIHVPNAIDATVFRPSSPLEGRPPRVAMLYSTGPTKGAAEGLEALERAHAEEPRIRAVLFGTERPPRLPDWAEYRRSPSPETLVGDVYGGSSIYLCPSRLEGWHLPPAEAMACGCALVSTDIGGVRDYADHGETALLAPAGDPAGLAAQLVTLLRDAPLRLRLARAGLERIAGFSWDRSTDALEAVFREEADG